MIMSVIFSLPGLPTTPPSKPYSKGDLCIKFLLLYPRKQSLGVYRNHPVRPFVRPSVCLSVRPSMYLVSATPHKHLIGCI